MRVSVVVPVREEEKRVAEDLRALSLREEFHEVVVSARDCPREFWEILRGVPRLRRVFPPLAGRGPQMNAGAAAAEGDVLLFLHADTHLEPGAARAVCEALRDPRTAGGAFRLGILHRGLRYRLKEWGANLRSRLLGLPFGDQAFFVRRAAFRAAGGFPDWPLFEDVGFLRRIRPLGAWRLLSARAWTSPRRWEAQGYLRATAKSWALLALYAAGVPPARLARWYS